MINLGFVKFSSFRPFRMMFGASERAFVIQEAKRRVFNISLAISKENISTVFRFLKGENARKRIEDFGRRRER